MAKRAGKLHGLLHGQQRALSLLFEQQGEREDRPPNERHLAHAARGTEHALRGLQIDLPGATMTKNATISALPRIASDPFEALLDEHLEAWTHSEREVCASGATRLSVATVHSIRSSRVLAAPIPKSLGGMGADLFATARAVRRVARSAPSTALCLSMPLGNAANTRLPDDAVPLVLRGALARGRAFIADKTLAGEILAVANSEPGAGGDIANTRTRAVRDGGRVRLTGQKSFATLGPDADYFLCSARTEDGLLDAFFVSRTEAGVRLADDWDPLGMRATASVGLTLDGALAAATFVYPGAIVGVNARHWSTLLMASVFVGIGDGALAAAVECAPRSSEWARSTLSECALSLDAASGFIDAVAREESTPCTPQHAERCRRAKSFAARTAVEVSARCMMIAGGRAYRAEHTLARALLDAAAGPLLRPPLAQAMDSLAAQLLD
ncbi:MAG: acyl-CoA dehydrogenase [Myxococcaceae bacterium]|nr:acyl-CoA dehydrogenase [Myxococcaceae bacterium]